MTEPNDDKLMLLFARALQLNGDDRLEFLAAVASDAPAIAAELHSLLTADERDGKLPEDPAAAPLPVTVSADELAAIVPETRDGAAASRRSVGRYAIDGVLGRGGMGVILHGRDPKLGRRVVLKTLRAGSAWPRNATSPRLRERFEREARIGSRLDHEGICAVLDVVEEDGEMFVVMPFLEGQTLARHIEQAREHQSAHPNDSNPWAAFSGFDQDSRAVSRPDRCDSARASDATLNVAEHLPQSAAAGDLRSVLRLLEKVARAVHAAHEEGVLHRDLKPGNIMVRPNGDPVVLDFGLALDFHSGPTPSGAAQGEPRLSLEGDQLGTPHYMAPEQAAGTVTAADRRTDIYALGVILYELLTLELPFDGRNTQEILARVLRGDPTPPRRLNPRVPADLEAVCLRSLELRPQDRVYATAAEFADDLRNVRTLKPTRARPLSPTQRAVRVVRRYPGRAGVAVAFVALLAAFVAYWLDRGYWIRVRQALAAAQRSGVAGLDAEHQALLARHLGARAWRAVTLDPTSEQAQEILSAYWQESQSRGDGSAYALYLRGRIAGARPVFVFAMPREAGATFHLVLEVHGDRRLHSFRLQRNGGAAGVARFQPDQGQMLAAGSYRWTLALDAMHHSEDERRQTRWEEASFVIEPLAALDAVLAPAAKLHDGSAGSRSLIEITALLEARFAHDALQRLDALPGELTTSRTTRARWLLIRAWALAQLGDRDTSIALRDELLFHGHDDK